MLVHYPVGAAQPARFDCKLGENDSGFRLTAAYHVGPPDGENVDLFNAASIMISTAGSTDKIVESMNDR